MKIINYLLILFSLSISFGQENCLLDLSKLIPKHSKNTNATEGDFVKFSRRIDLPKTEYQILEFYRPAEKKELKKPEKIGFEFRLIEQDLYKIKKIKSLGIFLATNENLNSYTIEEGILPFGVQPIDKIDLVDLTFEIEEQNEDYIVLRSSDRKKYIFYDSRRSKLLLTAEDKEETEERKKIAKNFIGIEVATIRDNNTVYYTDIVNIEIKAFETHVTFGLPPLQKKIFISAEDKIDKVYYLGNCYRQYELNLNNIKLAELNRKDSISRQSSQIESVYDEFKGRTFYQDARGLIRQDLLKLYIYYSIKDGNKNASAPHLYLSYQAHDWLFINSMTFLIDDKRYSYNVRPEREVLHGGKIEELLNTPLSKSLYSMFNNVTLESEVKVRLTGKTYYDDFILTKDQVAAIYHIVQEFKKKGGSV